MSEQIKDSKHVVPDDSIGFESTHTHNTHDVVLSHDGEKSTQSTPSIEKDPEL